MQIRHSDRSLYFREQEYTTQRHVIPFIGALREGMRVLEIGCGEGGNLKPFLDRGLEVTGIDISEGKIQLARTFFAEHPRADHLRLIAGDIYNFSAPELKYDLVFMRDVIEHIHDQERFLGFARRFMHPGSHFYLAFPPWQNPFGGHQQICRNRILSRLPYFHLLPCAAYRRLLKWGGESETTIATLLEVRETRLSVERFEKITAKTGYRMLKRQLYLINPNYEIKYKLRPVRQAGIIAAIPHLRDLLTTTACYLLSPGP